MATVYLNRTAAVRLLMDTNGRIFTVAFHRRNDSKTSMAKKGDLRVMNCRTGVTKGLVGGPAAYAPEDYDLFWVYDLKAKTANKRRSINIRGLEWIKFQGVTYKVIGY